MTLLVLFAFVAGFVTILSPCILPILPVVLSGSVTHGHKRPLGIVFGFVTSFTFFTLFLSTLVGLTGISADALRLISVIAIFILGLSLLYPKLQGYIEQAFASLTRFAPRTSSQSGFFGGIITGLSLGLIWTPCVGPILASVISLALSGDVSYAAAAITFSYALGTAIPMLIITYTGQSLFQKVPWLLSRLGRIQQIFGVLMILTAFSIYFNLDRQFQTAILNRFPNYGTGLTSFEDNQLVQSQLDNLFNTSTDPMPTGRPSFEANPDNFPQAPEIIPGGQWFNSEAFTLEDKRGQVVLVDFWTYSCINCIRTLPYLRSWHQKYADQGLVILGVHSPEFEFEKSPDNLQEAIADFNLEYPIVQDNKFATWRNYNNRYWPAKYLIDKNGRIRYTHFGEGKYDETEQMIQTLLTETGQTVDKSQINNPDYDNYSRTPELYLGHQRIRYLQNQNQLVPDELTTYQAPTNLDPNHFSLSGTWLVSSEYSQSSPGGSLTLNFEAKDVYLVMNSTSGELVSVEVYLDNQPVTPSNSGADIKDGSVIVSQDRLYHLISLPEPGQHQLKLEFPDGSIQAFAFTFG